MWGDVMQAVGECRLSSKRMEMEMETEMVQQPR